MGEVFGAGSGNRTRALSLEGSYDTISPYPRRTREVCQPKLDVKAGSAEYLYPAGIWISGFQSSPPASTSVTRTFGSALKRLAKTHPADPPPIII